MNIEEKLAISGIFAAVVFAFTSLAAMLTHIFVCIKTSSWILLLFGLFFPPVGVIHGVGVWLGIL